MGVHHIGSQSLVVFVTDNCMQQSSRLRGFKALPSFLPVSFPLFTRYYTSATFPHSDVICRNVVLSYAKMRFGD